MASPSTPFRPTRAMMLAAGLGKRMRPLTATTPKPLIEVAGKALIDHGLDRMATAGITDVVVNVHYLADFVEVHVSHRSVPKAEISDERSRLLDTGGGLKKALPMLGEEPFLLMNSDSFWVEGATPNLELLIEAWDETRMDALLLLAPMVNAFGYDGHGDFFMTPNAEVRRRKERSVAPFVYAGVAILHPRLFEDAPDGPFSLNTLFDKAIEAERLFGVRMEGIWLHVGTPRAIREAEAAILESAL